MNQRKWELLWLCPLFTLPDDDRNNFAPRETFRQMENFDLEKYTYFVLWTSNIATNFIIIIIEVVNSLFFPE